MINILKNYWYVLLILILVVPFCFIFNDDEDIDLEVKEEKQEVVDTKIDDNIYVDIRGEVNNPGVYEVLNTDRVKDVIDKAGGLTKNADISLLNLSKKVVDEMSIKIYSKKEISDAIQMVKNKYEPEIIEVIKEVEKEVIKECECNTCAVNEALVESDISNKDNKININSASLNELMTLSGIGESKAKKIIEYREETKFNSIEDIKNVAGISDAIFEKIKDYIKV